MGQENRNEIDERKTKGIVKWIKGEWINEDKWNWWEIMWKLKWKGGKMRKIRENQRKENKCNEGKNWCSGYWKLR